MTTPRTFHLDPATPFPTPAERDRRTAQIADRKTAAEKHGNASRSQRRFVAVGFPGGRPTVVARSDSRETIDRRAAGYRDHCIVVDRGENR